MGYKAYEAGSYSVLIVMAGLVGASEDAAVLQNMKNEEDEMGNWLAEYLPNMVQQFAKAA